ncbi:TauD/TfdA family dioxygenase [Rivularia sp. UHCC 0363]|uniref:TauD/TfdA family dioxygenase n=1 Tax=Rivularia sp. UHCC 0363 TaxID=3110244 RepID=UPI002B1EA558|nr:TauD/TfdA family dioxygenase [Rivularia sp. UHCC 0363]MEA5593322.1 TauD/TfdA family dioxygenase [Rivularia sp. UHCC 0363]
MNTTITIPFQLTAKEIGKKFNQDAIDKINAVLSEHGAVLLRGFPLNTADDFAQIKAKLIAHPQKYFAIVNPRTNIEEKDSIYTSTEIPSQWSIPLHSELTCSFSFPDRIFFFCQEKPEYWGQTPICDTRRILKQLPTQLVDKIRDRGVRYTRRLPKQSNPFSKGWSEIFNTESPDVVEERCKTADFAEKDWNINWDGDVMMLEHTNKGILCHPRTQEEIWFNQITIYHNSGFEYICTLTPDEFIPDVDISKVKQYCPTDCTLGDGTLFSRDEIEAIWDAYAAETIVFDWEQGDVLLLDNLLFAHGRKPFRGNRQILVSMGS